MDPAVRDELRGERRDRGSHHGPFRNIRDVAGADQASSCTILAAERGHVGPEMTVLADIVPPWRM